MRCSRHDPLATFAGYVVESAPAYADPAKVETITRYPEPTKLRELRGWFGIRNQMQNYVPGLEGMQKRLRTLLNKGVVFWVDDEMREELERSKKAIGNKILLNNFCMKRAMVVITDASGAALPLSSCSTARAATWSYSWAWLQSRRFGEIIWRWNSRQHA